MKKFLAILMLTVMVLTTVIFTGCTANDATTTAPETDDTNAPAEKLKLGLGSFTTTKASDATADKAGQGQATTTIAAVLFDADGKIVKAFIDCADNTVTYTADGKAVAVKEFKTKYELGDAYNMVAYGGAKSEWYKQADAFCKAIEGKSADEVKALVADGDKGTDEVISAGCTIMIADFAKAVEKASAAAVECGASKADTVKLGVSTTQTTTDATAEKAGSNKVATTFYAAAVDADGKVTAAKSDCIEVSFTFDITGKSTFDTAKAIKTKGEQGADYNMVAYGGAKKEWFEQAAAFDAATIGKKASDMAGLMGADNKGVADIQSAGCTITIEGFVAAAAKIG